MARKKTMTVQDKTAYRNNYNLEHYIQLRANVPLEERIPERIEEAVKAGKAASKQAYIANAVRAALEADGFPIES